jgi:hypothetical protein
VRSYGAIVLLAAALGACGSSSGEPRVERCVDRLLGDADPRDARADAGRRYVRETYCERFGRNGWIYEDGALSIAAHTWLEEGGTCETGMAGEPARTVPCDEIREPGPERLECGLLRHVRRIEVRDYVERRRREGAVECDDGTPLDGLGVP